MTLFPYICSLLHSPAPTVLPTILDILSYYRAKGDRNLSYASLSHLFPHNLDQQDASTNHPSRMTTSEPQPSEPFRVDEADYHNPYMSTQVEFTEQTNPGQPFYPSQLPMEMSLMNRSSSYPQNPQQLSYFQQYQQPHDLMPPMPMNYGERPSYGESSSYGDRSSFERSTYERNFNRPAERPSLVDDLGRSQKRSSSDDMLVHNTAGSLRHLAQPVPISQPSRLSSRESDDLLDSSFSESPVGLPIGESGFVPASLLESNMMGLLSYPDMTTMVNSDRNVSVPLVETTFVDPTKCSICGKKISRDMIRHMWTHQTEKRFKCVFPKGSCQHKSGLFNRRYDFKKHLLNKHFRYDDVSAKREHNLREKLTQWGTCPCGRRFLSGDWLSQHILTKNESQKCPLLRQNSS